jgi:hypothetical protein
VTLYLDGKGDAAGPFGPDDHEIYFRPSATANYKDFGPSGPGLEVVGNIVNANTSYTIEIGLRKSSLSAGLPLPQLIGVNLGVSDEDFGFLGDRDYAYGVWYQASRPVCPSCCTMWGGTRPWCDTTTFALLRLE